MIYGQICNSTRFYAINDRFSKAFEFINKAKTQELSVGKYEIDGENIFALVQEYESKEEDKCRFEAHRKYIDIQCILVGTEVMKVSNILNAFSTQEYSPNMDIEFFECRKKQVECVVQEGEYCIFWPTDVHKPGICYGSPQRIKKVVVKVII